jgi:Type IV secretory pathway, VirB3-like protein
MAIDVLESSGISKSLLTDMTTFGVDDWLFVMNVSVALIMAMVLKIYIWCAIAALLHFVLMVVTRLVPNILGVYGKYFRQSNVYSAVYSPMQKRGLRPVNFGRGVMA